jgi:hypothetical protein
MFIIIYNIVPSWVYFFTSIVEHFCELHKAHYRIPGVNGEIVFPCYCVSLLSHEDTAKITASLQSDNSAMPAMYCIPLFSPATGAQVCMSTTAT